MEMDSTAELAPSGVTKGPADPAMGGGGAQTGNVTAITNQFVVKFYFLKFI